MPSAISPEIYMIMHPKAIGGITRDFQGMKQGIAVSDAPVIFSHSPAKGVCKSSRNIPDNTLRLVVSIQGITKSPQNNQGMKQGIAVSDAPYKLRSVHW